MRLAPVIARRELNSYFFSPIAYVALTIFLLASGFVFLDDFEPGKPAAMRHLFEQMVWFLVFIIPVLSMGLLSQEWNTGTMETLMTAPVSEVDVIAGKFLGALYFFCVLLAPTFIYVIVLRIFGSPDLGPIIAGYLGIFLAGALFISIGLFCSSLTRSQIVAAVSTAAVLFAITIAPRLANAKADIGVFWQKVVEQSVYGRYVDFGKGIIDIGHIIFFVAATAVFLFLTTKVLESRRWK